MVKRRSTRRKTQRRKSRRVQYGGGGDTPNANAKAKENEIRKGNTTNEMNPEKEFIGWLKSMTPEKRNSQFLQTVEKNRYYNARLALVAGADINSMPLGKTALLVVCEKLTENEPAKKFALELIEKGADVNLADGCGRTPLMGAVRHLSDGVEVVKALIKKGANVNARVNCTPEPGDQGYTALKYATKRYDSNIITELGKDATL